MTVDDIQKMIADNEVMSSSIRQLQGSALRDAEHCARSLTDAVEL